MRHRVSGRKLGRRSGPRRALLGNLASELIMRERVTTTEAKAREVRGLAEKVITKGKRGSLHDRRIAATMLPDKHAVKKVFDDLGPRYASREGGYTRMLKLLPRKGDAASMALLELVEE